jgi:hypothetical protein
MAGEFDKDFGYLMPFLDKIAGAALSLADPAARAELTKLMADEKAKWARIRELLGGAAGQAATAQAAASGSQDNSQAAASPALREPFSFTVGSLRPKRP